ncbi:MAG: tetratricopeptide repeat protein, partial [Planctomycetota bacterium]
MAVSTDRHWRTALATAIVIGILVATVWSAPGSRLSWLVVVVATVFAVMMFRNPARRYERYAQGALALAAASAFAPSISAYFVQDEQGFAFATAEWGWVGVLVFGVISLACFGLDFFKRERGGQEFVELVRNEHDRTRNEFRQLREAFERSTTSTPIGPGESLRDSVSLENAIEVIASFARRGLASAVKALDDASPSEAVDALIEGRERICEVGVETDRAIAETAYRVGRIKDAKAACERILAAIPGDFDATNRLGHVARLRGDLDEAMRRYQDVHDRASGDSGRAAAFGNMGLVARTRGDLDEAMRLFGEALEINKRLGSLEGQAIQLGNMGLV